MLPLIWSIHAQARRKRVRQAEADAGGRRELLTSSEREELAGLRREVKQLRKATEILNGLLGRADGASSVPPSA